MQPPGAAATAAHTAAHAGHGEALADAVTELLAVTLADTLAVSVGVGVGLQVSQQAPLSVALPTQSQVLSGHASSAQYAPEQVLSEASERGPAPTSWRRRNPSHE